MKKEYTREEIEEAEKNLSETEMKREWWNDVRTFDPSPDEIEKRIWRLFADAHVRGIDCSTALLIVRVHAKTNNLPVKDRKIVHKAWGVYFKGKQEDEARFHEQQDRRAKPSKPAPALRNLPLKPSKPETPTGEKET